MRSSSTQPPDTEPCTWPSSRMATIAPTGRGAEPQVLTIVPSATRRPSLRQPSAERSTSISTLSMRKCYRNAAPFGARAFAQLDVRAVADRDLPHDGKAEAAAGARSAWRAVETLEYAASLKGRNARPVVFNLNERMVIARAGAHRHAAAAVGIFDRVVHQVGECFTQEKRVTLERRRLELEAQVDVASERLVHPRVGFGLDHCLEIDARRIAARARLGAGKGQQLIGEARGADRRLVHLVELRTHRVGKRLR